MGWDDWTVEARRAIANAQNEARNRGDSQVCTEHLLLGVLGEDDPLVVRLLEHLHIPPEQLRQEIERNTVNERDPVLGDALVAREIPLAPRVRRVMDLAEDEARQSADVLVHPAQVFLGLLREGDGLAGRILSHLGSGSTEEVRRLVAQWGSAGEYSETVAEAPPHDDEVK